MSAARYGALGVLLLACAAVATAGPGTWTQLGPPGRPALTVDGGGASVRVAVDPHDPAIVYVIANEGFFRSIDGGATWSFEVANEGLFGIPPLIVPDPRTPGSLFATVSTSLGESIDGGQTFSPSPLGAAISLAFDPATSGRLYAVTASAFLVSLDGGATWAGSSPGPSFDLSGPAIALEAGNPGRIWAARGDGLDRSDDGGQTWAHTGWTQSFRAVHAAQGTPATLYLVTQLDGSLPGSDVRRSADGGDTWQPAGPGAGVGLLVVDPMTPTTLLAVSTALEGDVSRSYLHRSIDGGTTWQPPAPFGASVSDLAIDPTSSAILYAATFGSAVLKSTNGGADWAPLGVDTGKLDAYTIGVEAGTPSILYLGTDLGFFRSASGGASWSPAGPFLTGPFLLAADPTTPGRLFGAIQGGPVPYQAIIRSVNGGVDWSDPLFTVDGLYRSLTALAVDPSHAGTVYVGVTGITLSSGLHRSTDGGDTWPSVVVVPPDPGPVPNGPVNAISVDPDDGAVYVATYSYASDGGIFRSADGGVHWSLLGLSSTTAFAIDPSDHAVLYAATPDGGLFKSTDRGATWSFLGTPAPGRTLTSLLVDPSEPARVFAATDRGVLASGNGGTVWSDLGPARRIYALAVDPARPNVILAASANTGLIEQEIVPCADDARCDDGDPCTEDLCRPGSAARDVIGCTHAPAIDLTKVSCLFSPPIDDPSCPRGTRTLERMRTRLQAAEDVLLRAAARRSNRQARLLRRARRIVGTLYRRLAHKRPSPVFPQICREAVLRDLRALRTAIGELR